MFRGDRLKQVREARGYAQRELAQKCELGEKQIWRYENNNAIPNANFLARIARELEVSTDFLLDLADDENLPVRMRNLDAMEYRIVRHIRDGYPLIAVQLIIENAITPEVAEIRRQIESDAMAEYAHWSNELRSDMGTDYDSF